MREIFIMQLQHILGGRMKWLVAIALTLPVLLSVAMVASGVVAQVREEIAAELGWEHDRQVLAAGGIPSGARRVVWEGVDREFLNGGLVLTRSGPQLHKRVSVQQRVLQWVEQAREVGSIWSINEGQYILRGDELWHNPQRKGGRRFSARPIDPGEPPGDLLLGEIARIDILGAVYLFLLYPQVICLLLALFYGTSVLGYELDGKTLTYLFTRPLPRWQIVVGKYLGIVTALVPAAALSMVASALILGVGSTLLLAMLAGSVGAVLAYSAVFILIGFLIPRRAMVVGLLYGIVFEFVLSFAPALVNEITVTYYLRSLVAGLLDLPIPREIARIVGGASVTGAIASLALIAAVCLALASLLAAQREYLIKDEA